MKSWWKNRMKQMLTDILKQKHVEVEQLKSKYCMSFNDFIDSNIFYRSEKFKQALTKNHLSIIAEVKRYSPSKGQLANITNAKQLADDYIEAGADAISVLTDNYGFRGKHKDLTAIFNSSRNNQSAVLRKDFIIDECQIMQSKVLGCDAVLLIVAISQEKTNELLKKAKALHLDVLLEVHTKKELDYALTIGADIIGINNRNLHTYDVDPNNALQLIKHIPEHIVSVAESGISSPEQAKLYRQAGFDAVLIGETLVKSDNRKNFINKIRGDNHVKYDTTH